MTLRSGFAPIARRDALVLILGSMPSEASLADEFYYAHPANAFWPLLAGVLGCELPGDRAGKRRLLLDNRIALWDVVHRCRRRGSLDSAIEDDSVEANDLPGFLARHRRVRHVFFNGATAERLFRRHFGPRFDEGAAPLVCHRLPSSSPANASWSRERKLAAWRAIRVALDAQRSGVAQKSASA